MKLAQALLLTAIMTTAAIAVDDRPIWQQEAEAAAKAEQNPLLQDKLIYSPSEEPAPEEPLKQNNADQPRYRPSDNPNISEIIVPPKEPAAESNEALPELPPPAPEALPKWVETKAGKIKILNKIFTRTTELELNKGIAKKAASLSITIEKCFRQPESDRKESAALILIKENFKSAASVEIFHGWMFSDSPAISALEHQQYDVILLTCEDPKKAEPKADAPKTPVETKTKDKNDKNKTPQPAARKEPAKKN